MVNYQGFKKDSIRLRSYLQTLSENEPSSSWTEEEKLAFWINAYNAFTIELIIRNYPLKSIKDITKGPTIPFINSPWDLKFIKIGGKTYDLNSIEHGIIRKEFNEPRIHFALVCAAISCPKLRREAFEAAKLDEQLDEQTRDFLFDRTKNKIGNEKLSLSRIFQWYSGDFKYQGMNLIDLINQYVEFSIDQSVDIDYLGYDWRLNEQIK